MTGTPKEQAPLDVLANLVERVEKESRDGRRMMMRYHDQGGAEHNLLLSAWSGVEDHGKRQELDENAVTLPMSEGLKAALKAAHRVLNGVNR